MESPNPEKNLGYRNDLKILRALETNANRMNLKAVDGADFEGREIFFEARAQQRDLCVVRRQHPNLQSNDPPISMEMKNQMER